MGQDAGLFELTLQEAPEVFVAHARHERHAVAQQRQVAHEVRRAAALMPCKVLRLRQRPPLLADKIDQQFSDGKEVDRAMAACFGHVRVGCVKRKGAS